jgi:hypothetical protein
MNDRKATLITQNYYHVHMVTTTMCCGKNPTDKTPARQGRQCTYNITWKSVCITIVAMEKQEVLNILSVCLQP